MLAQSTGHVVLGLLEKLNLKCRISGLSISDHHKAGIDIPVQKNELNSPNQRLSKVSSSTWSGEDS